MKAKKLFNSYNIFFLFMFLFLTFFIAEGPYPTTGWTQETMATPYTGKLSDGKSSYNLLVPQNWNGTVLVSLDYLGYWGEPKDRTIRDWLLNHGYAIAGTDRESVGWNLSYAAANVVETLDTFIRLVGEPRRAVVWGESRGGITTRAAIQLYPDRFDGAIPMCGGGAGSIAMYNFKLDAAFALDVLLGSEYGLRLELNNIQDLANEESRIKEIISKAQETPQGRARVALAGAFSQIPVWNQKGKPEPAKDDYDAQQANVALGMPMALGTRYVHFLEDLAGGPFTWNHGVDYREQLNNSGHKNMVHELYNKAGLDLEVDLNRLAEAPRVCADPAAVSFIEKNGSTWNGQLQQPVLSLTTTGDMAGPISDENSYADVVRFAGRSHLLRQAFVHRCDHCNFTAGEEIAAFVTLFKRLDTGKWEDDASAQSLNRLVTKLQSESSLDLGDSSFVQMEPPKALRTWDARNWDTYSPDMHVDGAGKTAVTRVATPAPQNVPKVNAASVKSIAKYLDFDPETTFLHNYCYMAILAGGWYEMGIQYAEQCPDAIKRNIADKLGLNLSKWGNFKAMYKAIPEYEAMLDFFPKYIDFCHGIADGLGIAYEDVFISMITLGPSEDACAAASAWGKATHRGEVYASIHSDSPHQPVYFFPGIIMYPDDGNPFVSFTGFSNGYMNKKGLACMFTYGHASAKGDVANGLPICIGALYNAAYSDKAEEALKTHIRLCRVGSGEIAHYVDSSGDAYILESTAGHYAARKAGDNGEVDFLLQSNSYLTKEMQSSGGNTKDNHYRYDSIEQYLRENHGNITLDVLRNALSNTSYYDKEAGKWVYEWDLSTGGWSPERKAPMSGCAMRRVFNLTQLISYILIGAEYDLVSKVPYALGTYAKISLDDNPYDTLNGSASEARLQLWYASRDIEAAIEEDEDVTQRMEYFNIAKKALYQGTNYQALGLIATDTNEQLSLYGKGLSLLNKAQCYAKAAQSGDIANLIDS